MTEGPKTPSLKRAVRDEGDDESPLGVSTTSTPDPNWHVAVGWIDVLRLAERVRRLEAGQPLMRILN